MMVFKDGEEVLFVRGDYSASGIVEIRQNAFYFVSGEGIVLPIDSDTDIIFLVGPETSKVVGQGDPREIKKVYMKLFDRREDLFKEFCTYYDKFKKEGSAIPVERAWIEFRRHWAEDEEGKWVTV